MQVEKTEPKTTKSKKQNEEIDFTAEDTNDYEMLLAKPSNPKSIQLTESVSNNLSTTLLPVDHHYEISRLHSLFNKPHVQIHKKVLDFDYSADFASLEAEENFSTLKNKPINHKNLKTKEDDQRDDKFPGDQGMDLGLLGDYFEGDAPMEMVEAPAQPSNLRIAYAKTAKRVDVKKLKSSLWQQLSSDVPPPPVVAAPESTKKKTKTKMVDKSFQQTLMELPRSIESKELSEISVPYCFICLLHLANEKGLEIQTIDQSTDLRIQVPSS